MYNYQVGPINHFLVELLASSPLLRPNGCGTPHAPRGRRLSLVASLHYFFLQMAAIPLRSP